MLSARTISQKTCLAWVLALALNAAAQEPERKPEAPVAPQTEPQTAAPEPEKKAAPAAQKPEPQQSAPKAEPQRRGGIQNVEATKESGKGSTANLGTDVAAVRQRIEAALASDPSLRGSVFNLNVTDDTIEITGVANSGRERTAARRIVQSFAGNLRVKDRITVAGAAPPPSGVPNSMETDKPKQQADAEGDALAKPESDEQSPQKKANKPKKDAAKHGDQSPEPRR